MCSLLAVLVARGMIAWQSVSSADSVAVHTHQQLVLRQRMCSQLGYVLLLTVGSQPGCSVYGITVAFAVSQDAEYRL